MLCLWTIGLPLRLPWTRSGVSSGTTCHGMLCLWTERLPFLPPRGERSVTGSKCSKPASKIGSSTCHGYRHPAVKLAAGLEPGRAGPADQCSFAPSEQLRANRVSTPIQTDEPSVITAMKQSAPPSVFRGAPVVNFLEDSDSNDDHIPCLWGFHPVDLIVPHDLT